MQVRLPFAQTLQQLPPHAEESRLPSRPRDLVPCCRLPDLSPAALPLAHSAAIVLASLPVIAHGKYVPASGPLHWLILPLNSARPLDVHVANSTTSLGTQLKSSLLSEALHDTSTHLHSALPPLLHFSPWQPPLGVHVYHRSPAATRM